MYKLIDDGGTEHISNMHQYLDERISKEIEWLKDDREDLDTEWNQTSIEKCDTFIQRFENLKTFNQTAIHKASIIEDIYKLLNEYDSGYGYDFKLYKDDTMIMDGEVLSLVETVEELWGHTTFRDFEEEHDDAIYYADGCLDSIIESASLEGFNINEFNFYEFDGWVLALWSHY